MTPRDLFDRMRQQWLSNSAVFADDMLADDVVLDMPFAAPGRPPRLAGKAAVLAFTRAGRASLPVRFEDCRNVVIHETTDPEVIVVEYELVGTATTTGVTASAPFIGVLRARDGKLAMWREYQNHPAIERALAAR